MGITVEGVAGAILGAGWLPTEIVCFDEVAFVHYRHPDSKETMQATFHPHRIMVIWGDKKLVLDNRR